MSKQPKALRLADELDRLGICACDKPAADELRRLHAINAELLDSLQRILAEPNKTLSDAEALREIIRIVCAASSGVTWVKQNE